MAALPSTPTVVSSVQNTLVVTFNSNDVNLNDFRMAVDVSTSSDTSVPGALTFFAQQTGGTTFVSEPMVLPINVPLFVRSIAFSRTGNIPRFSADFLQFQYNAPVSQPEEPYLVDRVADTITVNFDTQGQTGLPPVTYSVQYSIFGDFSTFNSAVTVQVSGTIFGSSFVVNPSSITYIRVLASNATSAAFSPTGTFDPAETGAPSGPTTVPVLVGIPTQTAITVSYSTAGITGNPPFLTQCFGSLSPAGPFNIGGTEVLVAPDTYQATFDPLLINTDFYFRTIISNGVLPNQTSGVSAAIRTAGEPANAPTIAPSIPVLNVGPSKNAIQIYINSDIVDGTAPVVISAVYDTNPNGPYVNAIVAVPSPDDLENRWVATASGLQASTVYYFKSVATNAAGFIRSQASAGFRTTSDSTNPADFAYMPPRPWAPENTNYFNGISLPWRQT